MNSLRNKFIFYTKLELHKSFIYNAFDIFLVSDSKIDSSFPNIQFRLAGYRMFRHDRDSFGEGQCIYLIERIPVKNLN